MPITSLETKKVENEEEDSDSEEECSCSSDEINDSNSENEDYIDPEIKKGTAATEQGG